MGKGTRWQRLLWPAWPTTSSTPASGHMMTQLRSPLGPPAAIGTAIPISRIAACPILRRDPNKLGPRQLQDRRARVPLLRKLLRLQPRRRQLPRLLEPCRRLSHLLLLPMLDRFYLS